MPRRYRYRRFTQADKSEIWRLVASGQRYAEVAAELGTTRQAVRAVLCRTGGLRPRPRQRSPRHLSDLEREEISRALLTGTSLRGIAARLARAPSTIVREVRCNGGRAAYRAVHAERAALERGRRPKLAKLVRQPRLRHEVEQRLARRWSPQQIAASLVRDYPDDAAMRISHETIYQALFIQSRGALRRELTRYLRTGRALRKPGRHVGQRKNRIPDMVNIAERPPEADERAVPGHWEGDLLIGKRNATAIATLVERASGFAMLVALPDGYKPEHVAPALATKVQTLPEALRRSLTWDQGPEMRDWKQVHVDAGIDVYFCDPHAPWQRGSNENTNGLLRQYFPKGTDFTAVTEAELDAVADELNDRPRKRLAFANPTEQLAELLLQ